MFVCINTSSEFAVLCLSVLRFSPETEVEAPYFNGNLLKLRCKGQSLSQQKWTQTQSSQQKGAKRDKYWYWEMRKIPLDWTKVITGASEEVCVIELVCPDWIVLACVEK